MAMPFRSRSSSEESATPPSGKKSSLAHWKGSLLASPKVEGTPLRVEALDCPVVRFDVVRDRVVLGNHLHKEIRMLRAILDSNFFGLESCHVNLGRDVVPNVVPTRDDHMLLPTPETQKT